MQKIKLVLEIEVDKAAELQIENDVSEFGEKLIRHAVYGLYELDEVLTVNGTFDILKTEDHAKSNCKL